jgi:hypothetical protein
MNWGLLAWVFLALVVELLLQGWIRQRIFAAIFRVTGNRGCALSLFSLVMLPGTLLHESSHVVVATVLGSRVANMSLKARYVGDGEIELGSVVAKDGGMLRNSVISIAPMIVGGVLILLIGWKVFDFPNMATFVGAGQWEGALQYLASRLATPWGLAGAAAILIISLNMFPSAVDLRSAFGLVVFLVIFLGGMFAIYYQQPQNSTYKADLRDLR